MAMTLPSPKYASESIFWRVVYQNSRGNHYLDLLELKIGDSGSAMMIKLRDRYRHTNARAPFHSLEKYLHVWTPVIETATLSPNSSIDLESQNALKEVLIVRRMRNIELAEAFYNPQILDGASNFVKNNDQYEADTLNGKIKKQVILVSLQASYIGLALLLVENLMLCIVPGIWVGTVTKSVDLGISVSSGIAGVLSFLSAVLIMVWGRNIRSFHDET